MTETILSGAVHGIVASGDTSRPIVVMGNVGMLHRVGPFRLYTSLCRRLASLGFASCRFDLAGLGDSDPSRCTKSHHERLVDGYVAVMNEVSLHLHRPDAKFVLIGICSGAEAIHCTAVSDPRVVGAVFIEGYAYKTPGYYFRRYTTRFLQGKLWRRKWQRIFAGCRQVSAKRPFEAFVQFPPKNAAEADICAFTHRGAKALYVFTGGSDYCFNHAGQFAAMYPKLRSRLDDGSIRVRYTPRVDHTFTMPKDRLALEEAVTVWLLEQVSSQ